MASGRNAVVALCECGCGQPSPISRGTSKRDGCVKGQPRRFISGHNAAKKPLRNPNPSGLCQCGCGEPTEIAAATRTRAGKVKGFPAPFRRGHYANRNRYGGLFLWPSPYGESKARWCIRARDGSKVFFARAVMEAHLGRHLDPAEVVHHINGDCQDDRLENLMLFPNHAAHMRYELQAGQRVMPNRWAARQEVS